MSAAVSKTNSFENEKGSDEAYDQAQLRYNYVSDPAAERKLVRKLDLILVPVIFVLYLFCFIDRTNIGNARIAGLEKDLGLKGFEYNITLTVFYIFYILIEVPSNVLCKVIGPRIWITVLVFGFGLITMCTAFIHNYASLLVIRSLLGLFEGGVMPGLAFLLTRFYTRSELVFRVFLFVNASTLAGAIGGLLASGLLAMGPITSTIYSWRNIFFVEGILSMGLAGLGYLILSDEPEGNRFLTEEERKMAVARLQAQNAIKADIVEPFKWSRVWKGMSNGFVLLCGTCFTLINISVQGLSLFTPTVVRTLYPGLPVVQQQLRTVPPYAVGFVVGIAAAYLVSRLDRRAYVMMPLVLLGLIGFAIFASTEVRQTGPRFASLFLGITGIFPQGPLVLAWAANNTAPDTVRGVAVAMVVAVGSLGAIVATWSFLPSFAPTYHNAAYINLGSTSLTFLLYGFALFYCIRENRLRKAGKRDHRLEGLTEREQQNLGSEHPEFMYSY